MDKTHHFVYATAQTYNIQAIKIDVGYIKTSHENKTVIKNTQLLTYS